MCSNDDDDGRDVYARTAECSLEIPKITPASTGRSPSLAAGFGLSHFHAYDPIDRGRGRVATVVLVRPQDL